MVDRHTLKSSNVWSRDLFLLFTVVITEKPASQRYDVEKGRSASIALFVIMGYSSLRDNQNEVISVDKCFRFSPLSFLISVSSSSSETVNFADPQAFIVNGSLTQSKEDTSSDGKYFSTFLLSSDRVCRIKLTKSLPSLQSFCQLKHFYFVLF